MKRTIFFLLLAFVAAGLAFFPADLSVTTAQNEIAVLTQARGDVRVRRGTQTLRISQTTLLIANDVVRTGANSRAIIFQAYVPIALVGDNQSRTIRHISPPPPPPADALTLEKFNWFKKHYSTARQKRGTPSPQTQGGPEDTVLTLLEPRNSTVLEQRPALRWNRVNGATRYTINVYDNNEAILWTQATTETQITYPEARPPLAPGKYKWDVTAQLDDRISDNPALYDATSFIIVSEQDAAEIRNELARIRMNTAVSDTSTNIVYISALMELKLYPQAQSELRKALERSPNDQSLWEFLMEAYFQMKLWTAREKARAISENANPTAESVRTLELRR